MGIDVKEPKLTRADFATDQTVRWCPGCGDYAILAQVQKVMPELGVPRENIVFVSGIGCSSRANRSAEDPGHLEGRLRPLARPRAA